MENAIALIKGSDKYPKIEGVVMFTQFEEGVLVDVSVFNLPEGDRFFGFHIHEGGKCTGNNDDAFINAGVHYNPSGDMHPYHKGDLPSLLGNNGYARMSVMTKRFELSEIIGRVVIIHEKADDFTTQPGGNAGDKIACGVIKSLQY